MDENYFSNCSTKIDLKLLISIDDVVNSLNYMYITLRLLRKKKLINLINFNSYNLFCIRNIGKCKLFNFARGISIEKGLLKKKKIIKYKLYNRIEVIKMTQLFYI